MLYRRVLLEGIARSCVKITTNTNKIYMWRCTSVVKNQIIRPMLCDMDARRTYSFLSIFVCSWTAVSVTLEATLLTFSLWQQAGDNTNHDPWFKCWKQNISVRKTLHQFFVSVRKTWVIRKTLHESLYTRHNSMLSSQDVAYKSKLWVRSVVIDRVCSETPTVQNTTHSHKITHYRMCGRIFVYS